MSKRRKELAIIDDILRERGNAMLKELTDSPKHTFTYGDVVRIIVKHIPELKTAEGITSKDKEKTT